MMSASHLGANKGCFYCLGFSRQFSQQKSDRKSGPFFGGKQMTDEERERIKDEGQETLARLAGFDPRSERPVVHEDEPPPRRLAESERREWPLPEPEPRKRERTLDTAPEPARDFGQEIRALREDNEALREIAEAHC